MRMHRETLKQYLQNKQLIEAIRQHMVINELGMELHEACLMLHEAGIHEADEAIEVKLGEYAKVKKAYGNLIKDVWGVTWRHEDIIHKYIGHDIDQLPEYAND